MTKDLNNLEETLRSRDYVRDQISVLTICRKQLKLGLPGSHNIEEIKTLIDFLTAQIKPFKIIEKLFDLRLKKLEKTR